MLGLLEMELCTRARHFVGSLPSTFSGWIHNRRRAVADASEDGGGAGGARERQLPYFRKVHMDCCDDATAEFFGAAAVEAGPDGPCKRLDLWEKEDSTC